MKQLKEYIKEGLFDNIDKLEGKSGLESNAKQLKKEIVDWISDNYYISYARKSIHKLKKRTIEVDMTTVPPTVNYNYDLYASNDLTSLNNDGMFQWGEFEGSFDCSKCKSLTTLEGAPKEVGDFSCAHCNSLKSLEGAPEKVGGSFDCNDCQLLKSLKGAPKKVVRSFYCNYCKSLKSLEGCPEEIGGFFNCMDCPLLTSLKGTPKKVGRDFRVGPWSDPNCSLTSLEGSPKEVGGNFDCYNCQSLKTLEGAPKKVGGNFDCRYCGTKFTEADVKKVSNVNGKIFC